MEARGEGAGRTEAGASQTHGAGGPPAGPAGAPRAAGTAALAGATRQAADRGRGSGGRPRSGRGPRGTFSKAAGPGAALLPRAPRGSSLGRGHVCPRAALPGRHGARGGALAQGQRGPPLSAARLGIPGPPTGDGEAPRDTQTHARSAGRWRHTPSLARRHSARQHVRRATLASAAAPAVPALPEVTRAHLSPREQNPGPVTQAQP